MVPVIGAGSCFVLPFLSSTGSFHDFLSPASVIHPRRQHFTSVTKEIGSLGFSCFGSKRSCCTGFVRRCKGTESEGDPALEAKILEFMKKSEKPNVFPSKKELIDAGRMDLVEEIVEQGGWLSLGWDLDEEEDETILEDELRSWNSMLVNEVGDGDSRIFQERVENSEGIEVGSSRVSSSSGRSIEMKMGDDEAGIEGILSRLEKERSLSFGFGLKESNNGVWSDSSADSDVGQKRSSSSKSLRPIKDLTNDSGVMLTNDSSFSDIDGLRSPPKQEMWRTWSLQRAGFSDTKFEAAEIAAGEHGIGGMMGALDDKIFTVGEGESVIKHSNEGLNTGAKLNDCNQIRSRLKHLESELASVLHLLRSRTDEVVQRKGDGSSSEDLQNLSDALEFQETEIMNVQDQLRSTRAKLAVLEGKMALAIIEAQKIVEEKQKRVDDVKKALCLLRTTYIVWPSSAAEVLLTGSFDGWATQRKMERSSTGIFSLGLKLYPGRYEIKFIVDGIWRIDPLRLIVNNNGYENNLLVIS